MRSLHRIGWLCVVAAACACASVPAGPPKPAGAPLLPDFALPEIPAALRATPEQREQHARAWSLLQAADLRGATREFSDALRKSSAFYPAEAGLGFVALADRQFRPAATRFRTVLGRDNRYVPAWRGLVEAELGAGDVDEAIGALERLLAIDNSRETDRTRLELLRLKQVQSLIQSATRAREAGRLDEAAGLLARALTAAPASSIVLRELALVELARGQLDQAEAHARRAIALDANDASAHGVLAEVLEARGRLRDAAAALARAAVIDPSWRARAEAARERADDAGAPEMRNLAAAPAVTRAQLAALIATRLGALVKSAPRRQPEVATDLRGHWASDAIVAVTQAGIMDVLPNHTFQPGATVRRADLAAVAGELLKLALGAKSDQLVRWQGARPSFADVPQANLFYRPAALAVTAGVIAADGGRFLPTRAATGAEVLAAVARIEQLAGR